MTLHFNTQDAYVSSSDIPGAKTGFTDLFKSKSNATIIVPESLVTSSNTRPPHSIITSSKKTHQAVTPHGTSSQTSQFAIDEYQIIDRLNPLAEETQPVTIQTMVVHTSQLDQAGEKWDKKDSQREQILKDTQNASPKPQVVDLLPSADLTIESRVQISTTDPGNPLAFGVIRWIGDMKNCGRTAGVEMVNILAIYICVGLALLS